MKFSSMVSKKTNNNVANVFDKCKYDLLNRILIKLQTRALGTMYERLFIIIPVLIYMNNMEETLIIKTKEFLLKTIKPNNLAIKVYDRVIVKLIDYKKDGNYFTQDKQRSFEIFNQNIQLYSIVEDILDDNFKDSRRFFISNIRKRYDESYKINNTTKKLLEFQEKHYV